MSKLIENSPKPRQRFTPRTLLEAKRISDPVFSPDGQRIAFAVTESGFDVSRNVSHIWITDATFPEPDSESSDLEVETIFPPRQLTFSHDGEHSPKWSLDGKYLAFLSRRIDESEPIADDDDEEEPSDQIWLLPVEGGEARKATSAKEGVLEYEWTPDGDELIFLTLEPRPQPIESVRKVDREHNKIDPVVEHDEKQRKQFWKVEAEERKPSLIATLDYGVQDFRISPDGSQLCYATNYSGEWNDYHRVDLWLLDIESKSKRLLCNRFGGKDNIRWSPDGSCIAFLSWLDPQLSYSRESLFQVICNSEIDAGPVEASLVTPPEFNLDIGEFEWSRHDEHIYAVAASGTGSELFCIYPGNFEQISLGLSGERASLALDHHSSQFAFVEETSDCLPELKLRRVEDVVRYLTKLNTHITESNIIPQQEVVHWQSRDGLTIEGVLTYPVGYIEGEKYPLIVQIHGGPKSRSTNTLRSYGMHPVWSAEGYMVLQPNFRGSEGYGNAFAIANRRDLGGGDYEDIMAGVDSLIERGLADPDRMGVMGGSYGGYMTNWIIGHSDRFRAAISLFGIFHLTTDYSNSDLSGWANDYLGAYYWEDPEIYRQLSPGSYLENMKTPTLIIHGDDDDNTYISNSKEMYQALRHRGVTTQFVHYPREKHGIREPNHRLDEIRRSLAWMDRFVLGGEGLLRRYRISDKVPSLNGALELLVTNAEIVRFLGHYEDKKTEVKSSANQTSFLEITFTIHNSESSDDHPPFVLTLNDIHLETSSGSSGGKEQLLPIGVPLDLPGAKMLAEGHNLHIQAAANPDTKRLSLACSVVFRVPDTSGYSKLHIPEFPPVIIRWSGSSSDDEEDEAD